MLSDGGCAHFDNSTVLIRTNIKRVRRYAQKGHENFAETEGKTHNCDIAQLFLKSHFHFSFSKLFKGFKVKDR